MNKRTPLTKTALFASVFASGLALQPLLATDTPIPELSLRAMDYDGDGIDDMTTYNPSTGVWVIRQSSNGGRKRVKLGGNEDYLPAPHDFDGDGKADVAVFRPADGQWIIYQSTGTVKKVKFGIEGDVPVPADYSGDGKADIAIFRPAANRPDSNRNLWTFMRSDNANIVPRFEWGIEGDVPLPGDYDGDGIAEYALFRPALVPGVHNTFFFMGTRVGGTSVNMGVVNDLPVPADYDGDGARDIAVFRPSTSTWLIRNSKSGVTRNEKWGARGDIPVPGKYDFDDKADIGVYRNGQWWVRQSSGGSPATGYQAHISEAPVVFGAVTDVPLGLDIDQDGKADMSVFRPHKGQIFGRPSTGGNLAASFGKGVTDVFKWNGAGSVISYNQFSGQWIVITPAGVQSPINWGGSAFDPVPADYNGDGRVDIAVYHRNKGTWHIRFTGGGSTTLGQWGGNPSDVAMAADYNNDNIADRIIFRDGTWYILLTNLQVRGVFKWGAKGDIPMVKDYDGDGAMDLMLYRPGTGEWFVRLNKGNSAKQVGPIKVGGAKGDIPVAADYDGDGKTDLAIYRTLPGLPFGRWYIRESKTGTMRPGVRPVLLGGGVAIPSGQLRATVDVTPKLDELIGVYGGGGGFIWKPVSEGDHKLVVLLPGYYRGRVEACWIANAEGEVVENGRFSGDTHNGARPHYRFSQKGAGYGTDIYVVCRNKDGQIFHWPIPNGANRWDY